jgi:ligand-binding sensor domain-containing protein
MAFNTTSGVVFRDRNGWNVQTRLEGVSGDDVRCGTYDSRGRYWAGTSTGLSCYSHGKWDRYRAIHGLPSDDVWSCAVDSTGTVWFGTTGGIVSIKENAITDRTPEVGLDDLDVRSIAVVGNTVYFGTESGKLITYTQGTWDIYGNRFLKTDKGIYSIAAEPSGTLWFGTNGDGVIRLENNKASRYTKQDGLPSNYVRSVAYSEDVLWAACFGGVGTLEPVTR